ncbi:MAG TPA: hypothetical protein V6C72_12090 [Chroococcales cyanobacterium]
MAKQSIIKSWLCCMIMLMPLLFGSAGCAETCRALPLPEAPSSRMVEAEHTCHMAVKCACCSSGAARSTVSRVDFDTEPCCQLKTDALSTNLTLISTGQAKQVRHFQPMVSEMSLTGLLAGIPAGRRVWQQSPPLAPQPAYILNRALLI